MAKKFAVFAKIENGNWVNIWSDGRSYKTKQAASENKARFDLGYHHESEVREIEVLTREERLEKALKLSREVLKGFGCEAHEKRIKEILEEI